jgi:hypothetical protein
VKKDPEGKYVTTLIYPEFLVNEDEIHHELGFLIQSIYTPALGNFSKKAKRITHSKTSIFLFDYQITYQSDKLISILFTEKSVFADEKTPYICRYAFTFDLKKNELVNLEQLFAKEKWQDVLSGANDQQVWKCLQETLKKDAFCVNKQGLLIPLPTNKAACPAEVMVPWHKIRKSVTMPLVQEEFELR